MTIKAIIELQAKPGIRDELLKALEAIEGERENAPGFLGFSRYEVIDDPDKLIEISEWETREARQIWLEKSTESGLLNRLVSTLKDSFNAVTVRQLK